MNRSIVSAACALALTAGAGLARADTKCNDFSIVVENEYSDGTERDIRVVDLSYWDFEDDKWRNEVTSNKEINYGDDETWTKNLEYVGGEDIVVRIHYRVFQSGSWSGIQHEDSAPIRCVDGGSVRVAVDN